MNSRFMDCAIKEAKLAFERGEVPVGAVIVKDGEIVSSARNQMKTKKCATAHAEMAAINEACKKLDSERLEGCELYVTLEPCPMCAGAIINARIKTVVFGAYDSKAGSVDTVQNMFLLPYNHKPEYYGGIKEKECAALLSEFFKNLR